MNTRSGSGIQDGKNIDPGSGINIPDLIFEFFWLKILGVTNTTPH
jgi:hypothetical protein